MKDFTSGGTPTEDPLNREGAHQRAGGAVGSGWVAGGDFFTSIMAAFLMGFALDWLLGTKPLFTVIGIIIGSVWGFYKMIVWSNKETASGR